LNIASEGAPEILKQGKRDFEQGHFEEAARAFRQAVKLLTAAGDELGAAEARNNQAVALMQGGDPEGALSALNGTVEVFEAAADKQRMGQALGNLAAAYHALGRLELADSNYREALALFQEIGDQDSSAHTFKSLSQLQLSRGETFEAVGSMQRGLAAQTRPSLLSRLVGWFLRLPSRFLSG
jgi:tetratricopeptide (TPR) repeat protein